MSSALCTILIAMFFIDYALIRTCAVFVRICRGIHQPSIISDFLRNLIELPV
ncbi:hypothetical protein T03_12944 [Trichinella britovi]|uniref:Uncharacterized protein n=1 Tax=Trichinella britovi TaxID=45882 RepID=A0A0V1AJS4_TRIBR|nr:hypothetical protein T03_12944 [Trichinella britovi]